MESTHPRKGTETGDTWSALVIANRINSSPQGDGNLVTYKHKVIRQRNQLIPARGRKPVVYAGWQFDPGINSSPQGDGNLCLCLAGQVLLSRINSSPQGDGNGEPDSPNKKRWRNQLIPARGRKRNWHSVTVILHSNQLIPARGRKRQLIR